MRSSVANHMPDPVPGKETTSGWEILASIVVGIGVILFSVLAGANGFTERNS